MPALNAANRTNPDPSTGADKTADTGSRSAVMQLAIRQKAALYAAYMPFVERGGLFVPTHRQASLGDEVYLILSLLEDPARIPVSGRVVWITPTGASRRQQGLGIQFANDEAGRNARVRIEEILGAKLGSSQPTHTI